MRALYSIDKAFLIESRKLFFSPLESVDSLSESKRQANMQTATQPNSGCYDSQHDDSQLKDTQPNNKNTALSIKDTAYQQQML
jgi:hypothetical protein